MMADPRAQALATNFAEQWLGLRNLNDIAAGRLPVPGLGSQSRASMRRETELFFSSIMSEDRGVTDLLKANYTFVDERLAKHYGIPNITGSRFRRVTLTDETRYGLLGQASVLTATSLANRTSPVSRGKWILEQILGVKAPVPPPNVPALKENTEGVKPLTVRDRLEQHRSVEPCASCHKIMDPLGFALESFDAVGAAPPPRRRLSDRRIGAAVRRHQGRRPGQPSRGALVDRSDVFVLTSRENLLTYALGRGVEYLRHAGGPRDRPRRGGEPAIASRRWCSAS